MREIEFRCDCGGYFIYSEMVMKDSNGQWWVTEDEPSDDNWLMCSEPQQYTGQLDNTGKKIYEGDIVMHVPIGPGNNELDGFTGEVKFIECGFVVENEDEKRIYPIFDECRQWQVIGDARESQ